MTTDNDQGNIANDVRSELCGFGGQWETTIENVLGEKLLVFRNRHRNLEEMFDAHTSKWSGRECLILEDTRITYDELPAIVRAVAYRLHNDYGVSAGDRVAILAANSPEWVITFFATTFLGAISVAINGWWTSTEIAHSLQLTKPKVLIGDSRRLMRADNIDSSISVIDFDKNPEFFEKGELSQNKIDIDEDDPALVLFTSGTTGRAKGALLSHRGLIGFVDGTIYNAHEKTIIALRKLGVDPSAIPNQQDVVLATSPLFHISGLLAGVLMNMANGTKIVFRKGRFDPADVLRIIESEKVTNWTAIGDMGTRVMSHTELESYDTSSLTRMSSGGAHLSEHMQEQIAKYFPQAATSIGQGYGSSESCGVVTSIGGQEFKDNPSSAGKACLGYEIDIRDENNNSLPNGHEGEIHVRSACTMLGYWGNPEATQETIKSNRWLAMGDIGRIENEFLFINARARDMIIRSGENIYPVEIEHRLEAHPNVSEAAVVGIDHIERGQEVKAIIVLVNDDDLVPEKMTVWCKETLANYKIPVIWEQRKTPLPRNASGKVVKLVLTGNQELTNHKD
ncbi:MAG: hypothetical protein CL470_04505 [Acidimicrobiaceae bacterium]|nr:hypothetical protein [Acidimicrobiaceae bacterium]